MNQNVANNDMETINYIKISSNPPKQASYGQPIDYMDGTILKFPDF